jgi:hypothetical protein
MGNCDPAVPDRASATLMGVHLASHPLEPLAERDLDGSRAHSSAHLADAGPLACGCAQIWSFRGCADELQCADR